METHKKNIILIGPMTAGKTTIGRQLARELKFEFYDSDHEIQRQSGADIPWIFDVEGEEGFRCRETRVLEKLTKLSNIVLATGGGSILSFQNRNLLKAAGFIIYLDCSIEQQIQRTLKCDQRPLVKDKNPYEIFEKLRYEREPLYQMLADMTVTTKGSTSYQIVKYILNVIVPSPLAQ